MATKQTKTETETKKENTMTTEPKCYCTGTAKPMATGHDIEGQPVWACIDCGHREPRYTTKTKPKAEKLNEIASVILGLDTLETRKSDDLDFQEIAVWLLKEGLDAAYEAGKKAGRKQEATRIKFRHVS